MFLFCQCCRRSCSLIPWCFGTLQVSQPTVVVPPLTSLNTNSPRQRHCLRLSVAPCFLQTTCCALAISTFTGSISQHPPSLPRVRDWSTVVHQSVLTHVSCLLPDFPARTSTLDFAPSPKSSSTAHLFVLVVAPPVPLWWNDARCHAFVARNGS